MTWKRTFIAAAIVANLIVFALPGFVIFFGSGGASGSITSSGGVGAMFTGSGSGVSVLVFGIGNLVCLLVAARATPFLRSMAIVLGCMLCLVMLLTSVVLSVIDLSVWPLIVLAPASIISGWALMLLQPEAPAPHRCLHCDYDLRSLPGTICPECGHHSSNKEGPA